jgi:hypothetical protein
VKVQDSGLKKNVFGPSQIFYNEFELVFKKYEKKKRFVRVQQWGFEVRGQGSSGILSQEGQELTTDVTVVSLLLQKGLDFFIRFGKNLRLLFSSHFID